MTLRPERLTELLEEVAHERLSLRTGSPTDAEIGRAKLADLAECYIPELVHVAQKLQAFKDFVHTTLDNAGVDKHEEQNATTGCRVGARLADLIKAALPAPDATSVSGGAAETLQEAIKHCVFWLEKGEAISEPTTVRTDYLRTVVTAALAAAPASVTSPQNESAELLTPEARSYFERAVEYLRQQYVAPENGGGGTQQIATWALADVVGILPNILAENARLRAALATPPATSSAVAGGPGDELLAELQEADKQLEADGYKGWCYARLAIGKAITALTAGSPTPIGEEAGPNLLSIEGIKNLVEQAKKYRTDACQSILRNDHMNELDAHSLPSDRQIDAVLVDFINYVALRRGMDLALYTADLMPPTDATR